MRLSIKQIQFRHSYVAVTAF